MTQRLSMVAVLCVMLLVVSGCGGATPTSAPPVAVDPTATTPATAVPEETQAVAPTSTSEPELPAVETEEPAAPESMWMADGVISPEEYDSETEIRSVQLWWRHDGEYLYMALEGPTEGWISVGIEPSRGMKDADYLFGFVLEGEAQFWDAFGTAPGGPNHPPDEELGGTNDVVAFAGVEQDGVTRFEFQIPLNSGDSYDKVLEPGQTYAVIVGLGPDDEYNAYHSLVASGEITLRE